MRLSIFATGFLALLLVALLTSFTPAQTVNADGVVTFESTRIDSTATVYSPAFSLNDWTGSFSTWSFTAEVHGTTTPTGTVVTSNIIEGGMSRTGPWSNVDTITVNDTLSTTPLRATVDFNGVEYPFYRHKVTGAATNHDSTYVYINLFRKRE